MQEVGGGRLESTPLEEDEAREWVEVAIGKAVQAEEVLDGKGGIGSIVEPDIGVGAVDSQAEEGLIIGFGVDVQEVQSAR